MYWLIYILWNIGSFKKYFNNIHLYCSQQVLYRYITSCKRIKKKLEHIKCIISISNKVYTWAIENIIGTTWPVINLIVLQKESVVIVPKITLNIHMVFAPINTRYT